VLQLKFKIYRRLTHHLKELLMSLVLLLITANALRCSV